jgi:hypothetical protein
MIHQFVLLIVHKLSPFTTKTCLQALEGVLTSVLAKAMVITLIKHVYSKMLTYLHRALALIMLIGFQDSVQSFVLKEHMLTMTQNTAKLNVLEYIMQIMKQEDVKQIAQQITLLITIALQIKDVCSFVPLLTMLKTHQGLVCQDVHCY